jgi:hypothetical protein
MAGGWWVVDRVRKRMVKRMKERSAKRVIG